MLARLLPVLVGIGIDISRAARKASDGGKRITASERRDIIADAVGRLVGVLDEALPEGEE